jgi:diguanylate cyclase (GGDEF)-like protein
MTGKLLVEKLVNGLDRFIPQKTALSSTEHMRQRTLVGLIILELFIMPINSFQTALFSDMEPQQILISHSCQLILWVSYLIIFLLFQKGLKYTVCAHMFLSTIYIGITGVVLIFGNQLTNLEILMIVVPVFAFCLLGGAGGFIWTSIVFVSLVSAETLSDLLPHIEMNYSNEHIQELRIRFWAIAISTLAFLQLIYESINQHLIDKLKHERDVYFNASMYDALTGLANRGLFETQLKLAINTAKNRNTSLCVIYMDLNNLKYVNDHWGHATGDEVVKEAAVRMQSCLRESDIAARIGGDEFAILLENLTNIHDVERVKSLLLTSFDSAFYYQDNHIAMGISIGTSCFPEDAATVDELIHVADLDMYNNKRSQLTTKNNLSYR